ncbi:MAG: hypothetical protein FWE21_00650 [Defluviitaleaceae bacterium]|nr:hypothetical protein [Defluviitaleaceae bacterium]
MKNSKLRVMATVMVMVTLFSFAKPATHFQGSISSVKEQQPVVSVDFNDYGLSVSGVLLMSNESNYTILNENNGFTVGLNFFSEASGVTGHVRNHIHQSLVNEHSNLHSADFFIRGAAYLFAPLIPEVTEECEGIIYVMANANDVLNELKSHGIHSLSDFDIANDLGRIFSVAVVYNINISFSSSVSYQIIFRHISGLGTTIRLAISTSGRTASGSFYSAASFLGPITPGQMDVSFNQTSNNWTDYVFSLAFNYTVTAHSVSPFIPVATSFGAGSAWNPFSSQRPFYECVAQ